jgi:ligand-binding sensor domain-containing protein/signal transduction histidine kinase
VPSFYASTCGNPEHCAAKPVSKQISLVNHEFSIWETSVAEGRLAVFLSSLVTHLKLKYILTVCFLLVAAPCTAVAAQKETIRFQHFGVEQGLPGSSVSVILLDSHGYLWIGTENGLCRYDGYDFQVYRNDPEDETSLTDNWVRALFEDRYGDLWIGTWAGLNRFDEKTGKFKRYLHNPHDDKSISSDSITAICEDGKGVLWIGTLDAGVNKFNRQDNSFTRFESDTSKEAADRKTLRDNRVRVMIRDHKGVLWIGGRGGWLHRLDPITNEFDCYRTEFIGVRALCEDHSGNIWLGTFNDGIRKFDPVTHKFESFVHKARDPASLANNSVNQLLVDRSGDLWIATFNGGLDRWLSREKKFEHHVHDPRNSASLSSNNATSLCEDRSGAIWVGTDQGLDKYFLGMSKFRDFSHDPDNPKSLSNNYVFQIMEDRSGHLWISTVGGGVDCFDRSTGVFEHFLWNPKDPRSIFSPYVGSVLEDRSGMLWVGTLYGIGDLDKLNPTTGTFQHFTLDPKNPRSLIPLSMTAIYEDRSGILWIGTQNAGLNKFNPQTGESIHFYHDPNNPNSLTDNGIEGFEVDASCGDEELLWIATHHGFTRFDVTHEEFQQFFPDAHHRSRSNVVNEIHKDHSGTLWLGTGGGGLYAFEPTTGVFSRFTTKDGLASDLVGPVEEDDHGRLWIGTSNGLSRFDPRTKEFKNYNISDGLPANGIISACRLRGGELCFGSFNGFTMFHPDSIKDNTHVPPIVITGFRKFNKPFDLHQAIGPSGAIEVSYKENVFSFEFAALDFVRPEKNQYAYKLEGFDKDWVYCGTRRSATYTNLDGGKYIFRVKGSNNDGVWNEEGTSIAVIITPPYWATWWFRGFAFVAVLVIVGGTIRYVEKRKLMRRIQQLEQERAVELERARISQDMHDEVGSSLSEISVLSELARKKPEEAGTYIQEISERAAELIDSVSEIVWAMNPRNDTLDTLLAHIRRNAVKYLGLANISCRFAVPDSIPAHPLHAELRRNLSLVVKEALHNIVKHSAATEVSISVEYMKDKLEVLVADNGKGFVVQERQGTGNGLKNMQKRIADVGGILSIDSMPGRGTRLAIEASLMNGKPSDLPNSRY